MGMHITVESQAYNLGITIDHRAARIAADNIVGGHKIIILGEIDFALSREPGIW